jgi:uncharacterized membrane protein YsdA (DUF1294 family)
MNIEHIAIGIFAAINLISFIIMGNDKRKSMRSGADRTPEGLLFFMAASFGAIGVYAGMFAFRHKTKKWYFLLGIPLLILQNLATLYLINQVFGISQVVPRLLL